MDYNGEANNDDYIENTAEVPGDPPGESTGIMDMEPNDEP